MTNAGFRCVSYLDDFPVIGDSFAACNAALMHLIRILTDLGFAVNWSKVISPCQRITFLGIAIDSVLSRIELPNEKLMRIAELARNLKSKRKVTKRELQVFVGHLNFASRASYGARTFTRIFIDACNKLRLPYFRLRLNSCEKEE